MRIAIVTAMAEETLPILKKLGNVVGEDVISGVKVYQIETEYATLYLTTCGIGEIRAAAAVQMLSDLFDVEAVLNFGFVGALDPTLNVGDLVIAESVCHHQFDISGVDGNLPGVYDGMESPYFELDKGAIERVCAALPRPFRTVKVASGDLFVALSQDKKRIADAFGAEICEMELAGIAVVAKRNGVPVFSLKVVSDNADESATVSFASVLEKGLTKYEEVLPDVLKALGAHGNPPSARKKTIKT